jgi:hypothetical protein
MNRTQQNKTATAVAKFKYTGLMTLTNQNCMCEEIKSSSNQRTGRGENGGEGGMFVMIAFRISCPSLCYQKTVKQNIHRTIIMPLVLHGCDTWSLKLYNTVRGPDIDPFQTRYFRLQKKE